MRLGGVDLNQKFKAQKALKLRTVAQDPMSRMNDRVKLLENTVQFMSKF